MDTTKIKELETVISKYDDGSYSAGLALPLDFVNTRALTMIKIADIEYFDFILIVY